MRACTGRGPQNIWCGVSVEDEQAKGRVEHLRSAPAGVRFLSVEPLIGAVGPVNLTGIDWVITGGGEYDLSFSLRFLGGTAAGIWGSYTVGYYDNAHTYLSDSGAQFFSYPSEWTEVNQSFTAPANAGYINVTFYGFAQDNTGTGEKFGQWALDDVSMNPAAIPEPGTLALLLGGFGLLAGARRFRKRS